MIFGKLMVETWFLYAMERALEDILEDILKTWFLYAMATALKVWIFYAKTVVETILETILKTRLLYAKTVLGTVLPITDRLTKHVWNGPTEKKVSICCIHYNPF